MALLLRLPDGVNVRPQGGGFSGLSPLQHRCNSGIHAQSHEAETKRIQLLPQQRRGPPLLKSDLRVTVQVFLLSQHFPVQPCRLCVQQLHSYAPPFNIQPQSGGWISRPGTVFENLRGPTGLSYAHLGVWARKMQQEGDARHGRPPLAKYDQAAGMVRT
ncbi:hypothetical protein SDC9_163993 [bioreactor metagenome]|uniref:Uncharacterized protein n=1 Tax=bioreactor metagenome TaxID=1076179 RepID=A0A645FQD9_9ZZZZ